MKNILNKAIILLIAFIFKLNAADIEQKIFNRLDLSLRQYTMQSCDEFENYLREHNNELYETAFVRINYNPQKGFYIGYKNDDRWNLEHLPNLLNYLNALGVSFNNTFSFFTVLWDACVYPLDTPSFFEKCPVIFPDKMENSSHNIILCPNYYMIKDIYMQKCAMIKEKSSNLSYGQRLDLSGWRGSQTGMLYSMESFVDVPPRLACVILTYAHPQLLDAKFVNYVCQVEDSESGRKYIEHMLSTYGSPADPVPFEDMICYKYLISIDGNCAAWQRPEHIMHSKSVLLMYTRFHTFYGDLLEDGVNYISIKRDMSDLVEKIELLKSDHNRAQKIAENAFEIAESVLTRKFVDKFYIEMLTRISKNFSRVE